MKKYQVRFCNVFANMEFEEIVAASDEKEAVEIIRKNNRGVMILGFPKLIEQSAQTGWKKVPSLIDAEEYLYEMDMNGVDSITLIEGFNKKTTVTREEVLKVLNKK